MAAPTRAELQARVAKLERALAREKKRNGVAEDLARARDAQAATARILRVIRKSPSNVHPVFEAIADAAMRLFGAWSVIVVQFDGSQIQYGAARGGRRGSVARVRAMFPLPLSKATTIGPVGRCIMGRKLVELPDARRDRSREMRELARARGFRSTLAVPFMNANAPIGAIGVTRVEAGHYTRAEIDLLQTFADQAVIALENARRFRQTNEALERQTATADILKVISGSPDDVQPVFDAVAYSSMRLLGALSASVSIRAGDTLRLGAFTSTSKTGDQAVKDLFPLSLTDNRDTILAQSVLKAAPAQVGDAQGTRRRPRLRQIARRRGFQSIIAVPMLSKGLAIGTVSVTRREAGGFSDHEVELLTTFADQSVIAIENVRLFNETKEALERQTGTAEILRVISGSPTDIRPVLDAVAENAARLCEASDAIIQLKEGNQLRWAAHYGALPNLPLDDRRTISRDLVTGRAVLEGRQIHIHDLQAKTDDYPAGSQIAAEFGYHTILATPLMREGKAIGVIMVRHKDVRPFNDKHLALVSTFADQAVIAIENVRLFNETKEALERQTATAEILKVISESPTDVHPVFDAIAKSAARLIGVGARLGIVIREGDHVDIKAIATKDDLDADPTRQMLDAMKKHYPRPYDPERHLGSKVMESRVPLEVDDTEAPGVLELVRELARSGGYRSIAMVPLLREGVGIGLIAVSFEQPGVRLNDNQRALLQTFADQAVIAIENVRLFNETKEALERQTATTEILKVIASSPDDVQPVFEAIVASAMRLMKGATAHVTRLEGGTLHLLAYSQTDAAGAAALKRVYPRNVAGTDVAEVLETRVPRVISDAEMDPHIEEEVRAAMRARGVRGSVVVPLVSKGDSVGTLVVNRRDAGGFSDHEIGLLQTFADQAVIAIENVRLFNETNEALERQTATSEILKVISSSPTDVQPVFDTIVKNAVELSDALFSAVYRYDGDQLHLVAHHNYTPEVLELENRVYPMRPDRGQAVGRAILDRRLVHITDALTDADYQHDIATTGGWRSMVAVPMFREGTPVGVIWVARAQIGPFSKHQIALLQTFADQAVIAIENVRLFNETKEALERQTASAEVLQVISGSLADTQPVFEVILESCERLFKGRHVGITLVGEDGLAHIGAYHGPAAQTFREMYPLPINRETGTGLAIIGRRTLHYPDAEGGAEVPESVRRGARITGLKSVVLTPLLGKDRTIGAMFVGREFAGAFSGNEIALIKTFADQAVIAIENVRLFNETKEALERQTATAEILRVISSSPTDVQPVFDMIGKLAAKLCAADISAVARFDGEKLQLVALQGVAEDGVESIRRAFPMYPGEETVIARAFDKRDVEHVADVMDNPSYARRSAARAGGYRGCLGVPMIREGNVIGVIFVARVVPGHFADSQVALLQTFADQAVIAIENVRLFNETKEALERQTATAEILEVMSRSQSDLQPVFDTIAASAMRLCDGDQGLVYSYDGELVHIASLESMSPEAEAATRKLFPMPANRGFATGRAILTCAAVQLADVLEDPEYQIAETARVTGWRSVLAVPMLRAGTPIGAIAVVRRQPMAFTDSQVALLKTFADQAVIAIENVRLFNETKEALERQTATAEILKVISGSPTDVQPVFDTIVESAVRLCDAVYSAVITVESGLLHLVAHRNWPAEGLAHAQRLFPMPLESDHLSAIAARENRVIHQVNLQDDPAVPASSRELAITTGYKALLIVPMVREGRAQGVVVVARRDPFSDDQITLLQTFADQAVIAIENVRLFNETREALERQTASADILRVISSTPADTQPVFDAIVNSAQRLIAGKSTVLLLRQDPHFVAVAYAGPEIAELPEAVRVAPLDRDKNFPSRAILDAKVLRILDFDADDAPEHERMVAKSFGIKSGLMVPLLREGQGIGAIAVTRDTLSPYRDKEVALLQSFADQAVIAIENVRLFNETKEALERQTATSDILRVISGSPTDVAPVFDAIAERARVLCGASLGYTTRFDGGQLHLVGYHGTSPQAEATMRASFPRKPDPGSINGRCVLTCEPAQIFDVQVDPDYQLYTEAKAAEYRSMLAVPMLQGGRPIGVVGVARREPGAFSERLVSLLQTFADQAVIAIENVRLFNETKEALEQQQAAGEILSVISSSVADTKPVFDKILESGHRLFGSDEMDVLLVDDQGQLQIGAYVGNAHDAVAATFPAPVERTPAGQAIRARRVVHWPDVIHGDDVPNVVREVSKVAGYQAMAFAPMLWQDRGIGAIGVARARGPFSAKELAMLQTFADQAVIAIQNARLFNETKEALERQTATAEILKVISESPTDVQPVFDAIVGAAVRLIGCDMAFVQRRSGATYSIVAGATPQGLLSNLAADQPVDAAANFPARAMLNGQVLHLPDWSTIELPPHERNVRERYGIASALYVPLLREGECIGVLTLASRRRHHFGTAQIALAESFRDQAVIAIENVRLFKELEQRTDALTKSVGQLTALGEVSQAISLTLDLETVLKTVVSNAMRLSGLDAGVIYEYDVATERFELRASENFDDESVANLRGAELRVGEGAVGTSVSARAPQQVPDTHAPDYPERLRTLLDRPGFRAVLAVPLLREEQIIGALLMLRRTPGPFAADTVDMLKTFASQSALAIQNARLFREIADKGRQLEEASQHKSHFLASMSHELRTPLNAILGFNEMIIGEVYGEVPSDMKEPLEDIQTSGKHLLRLINNVLDLAKIEAGRMELALADYAVQDLIESVRATLKPLAEAKGLEFLASVPAEIPLAYGDFGRLTQCLMNLAGNSLKFTKTGSVAIAAEQNDATLIFRVVDTGIGIPPEKIDSLFTEFKQTDATIASEYGGTGLGLSITKQFIEMHGGRIWIESELGKGSSFIFEIPLRAATGAAA